jgi:hypothetical protein
VVPVSAPGPEPLRLAGYLRKRARSSVIVGRVQGQEELLAPPESRSIFSAHSLRFIDESNPSAPTCRQNMSAKDLRYRLYTCAAFGASAMAILVSATLIASGIGLAALGPLRGPGQALRHVHWECRGKDFVIRVGLFSTEVILASFRAHNMQCEHAPFTQKSR